MSEIDRKIINEESSIKRDNVVIESGNSQEQGSKLNLQAIKERREKVKELYEEEKTYKEIADIIGINITAVKNDLMILREMGVLPLREKRGNKGSKQVRKRREQVKELYIAGRENKEIASIIGISLVTVNSDITILRKAGELQKREKKGKKEKRENKASKQVRERREQVKKLKEAGKGNKEIASLLGLTEEIVYSDIRIMRKAGKLQIPIKDEKKIRERREQVEKLKEAGKTYREMASILGTTIATIHSDLEAIKEKERLLLKSRNKGNKNEFLIFSDIDKKVIQGDKRLKRIVKYIMTCESGQHAINYAKSHQNSRYLTEEGREMLKRFIKKSEDAQSRNVMRLLNDGKSLKEIKEITDYEESIIVRTNNTYLKNKAKTENER